MEKIIDIKQVFDIVSRARLDGKTIGVVPTMGALHAGHLSLVEAAKTNCDFVVTTIFVNPTQFAPNEDLNQYPRPLDEDLSKLAEKDVDVAFCPRNEDVYPLGFSTYIDPPSIAHPFEGQSRSTHFRGVATIVLKLFQMVPADRAYFGQKDYQQTLVIKKMVEDLNLPIEIVVCPIVREPDGLAMSSRNVYLSAAERQRATSIHAGLRKLESDVRSGMNLQTATQSAREFVAAAVDELEYLELVDAQTLEKTDEKQSQLIALVAARVGTTRLIDNVLIE